MARKAKNIVWKKETQTNEYLTLLTRRALNKAHKNWETCTINDFDLDRVYLDLDGREYTIRMWNIQDCGNKVQTTYTLYIDMWNKEEGYGYGVEIVYGRFLEKASLLYGEDDEPKNKVSIDLSNLPCDDIMHIDWEDAFNKNQIVFVASDGQINRVNESNVEYYFNQLEDYKNTGMNMRKTTFGVEIDYKIHYLYNISFLNLFYEGYCFLENKANSSHQN